MSQLLGCFWLGRGLLATLSQTVGEIGPEQNEPALFEAVVEVAEL